MRARCSLRAQLPKIAGAPCRNLCFVRSWFPSDTFDITFSNGTLAFTHQGGESKDTQNCTLTEVQPGLLVSDHGNTFDLRGPVLLVNNYRVVKADPQALPFKIALYTLCGLLFLSALFAWPAGALLRRVREKGGPARASEAAPKGSPWLVLIRVLAALASLVSLFFLAPIALVPYLVYFAWPSPWPDLLWWQAAFFRLPFASLLLGAGFVLLAVLSLRKYTWARNARWYYLAVGLAVIAFKGVILVY